MEAPLPAQPHTAASVATKHTRRRTSKKKASGDFMHQHAAEDWIRALASRGVKLTASLYRLLFELAQWCGPAYGYEVRPWVFDPVDDDGNPLLDNDGNLHLGILSRLGISYSSFQNFIAQLQRICESCRTMHATQQECDQPALITRTSRGRGNRIRRKSDGGQLPPLPNAYLLNVRPIAIEKQEPLFRTESDEPTGSHVMNHDEPTGSHVMNHDEPTGSHVMNHDEPTGSHVMNHDEPTDSILIHTSIGSHTSRTEPPPTSTSTARDSSGGEDGGGSFCSTFLVPAFENVGLTGFTEASLNFVEYAVPRFAEIHGRQPDKAVADHMAERLVKFIRQEGIDISVEPHRILSERGGYLRNVLVPSVLEAGMALRFEPVDSEPEPVPQAQPLARERVDESDWKILHTAHVVESRTKHPAQVWDAALGELQQQVARPAFETWLRDTGGVGITNAEFYVGTANSFVSEMLEHRMYPLIERAVEKILDAPIAVRFVVVSMNADQSDCPLCEELKE